MMRDERMENKVAKFNNEEKRAFVRGEIYYADIPFVGKDSRIQHGIRPIVIVVNDMAGKFQPTVQYVPLTTKIKRTDLPVHAVLTSGNLIKVSMAEGEQLGSIDTYRILEKMGKVSEEDMYRIDLITMKQLGTDETLKKLGIDITSIINLQIETSRLYAAC